MRHVVCAVSLTRYWFGFGGTGKGGGEGGRVFFSHNPKFKPAFSFITNTEQVIKTLHKFGHFLKPF